MSTSGNRKPLTYDEEFFEVQDKSLRDVLDPWKYKMDKGKSPSHLTVLIAAALQVFQQTVTNVIKQKVINRIDVDSPSDLEAEIVMRESTRGMLYVLAEFQNKMPPNFSEERFQACSACFPQVMTRLKEPLDKRRDLKQFPAGDLWDPLFRSFYLYSSLAISHEGLRIAELLGHKAKKSQGKEATALWGTAAEWNKLFERFEDVLKTTQKYEARKTIYRKLCAVRAGIAQLDLHSRGVADELSAQRGAIEELLKDLAKPSKHKGKGKSGKAPAQAQASSSSASLVHTPISRRLLGRSTPF